MSARPPGTGGTGGAGRSARPIGVVLAGGAGQRLGGAKATASLGGRPLICHPLAAIHAAGLDAAVVAKPDTELPPAPALGETAIWREPAQPRHPLAGIVWALLQAQGRPVVVCAVDLPFVDAVTLRALITAGGPGTVVTADGQPLLGRYPRAALEPLEEAVAVGAPARAAVARLQPVTIAVAQPSRTLLNVNTPEDLAAAEAMLAGVEGFDQPNVKS